MTEPSIVVGVDGGGTKTHVCVATTAGEVLGFTTGGCANWETAGLDGVAGELAAALDAALTAAGVAPHDLTASAFCLAGMDWPSDAGRIEPVLADLGLGGTVTLTNDSFAALRAGTPDPFGCVSVAGTGGVCAGKNRRGETARTMAIAIGEASGAWGLVRGALDAVAAAHHTSGPPTALTERLVASVGGSDVDAYFEGLSRGEVRVDAGFATEVFAAADDGDEVARDIAGACGAQHGRDLAGVVRRLGMADDTFDVVLAGGVHTAANPVFSAAFAQEVHAVAAGAHLRTLVAPPVAGAVLLAIESAGVDAHGLHDTVTHAVTTGAAS